MIALWGVVAGILIGYLRKGRLANIALFQPRHASLVFVAIVAQLLIFPTPWSPTPPIRWRPDIIHLASYGLIALFLIANRSTKPFWGIFAGMGLNLFVIAVNGGFMPSDVDALTRSGHGSIAERLLASPDGTYGNVVLMSDATRFNFLGDVFAVPPWIPLAASFSLGDLVLMVSVAWLIQLLMLSGREDR